MPEIPAAEPARQKETTLEFLSSLASVFVIGLFVITFVLQAFEIPSASMEKTLLIGDHVFVDRITLAPAANWMPLVHYRPVQRGDIVVFLKPGEPDLFLVKRVVGVPGDHIHLKDGVVYRNGEPLNEPFARKPADAPAERQFDPYRDQFPSMLNDPGGNQTATWQVALPGYVRMAISSCRRTATSAWVTTGRSRSTAATGASSRKPTWSGARCLSTGRSLPRPTRWTSARSATASALSCTSSPTSLQKPAGLARSTW